MQIASSSALASLSAGSPNRIHAEHQANDGAKNIAVGTPIAIVGEEGDDLSGAEAMAKEGDDSGASAPKSDDSSSSSSSAQTTSSTSAEPSKDKSGSMDKQSTAADQKDASQSGGSPALATPADETKYGSGGGTSGQKAPPTSSDSDKPKFFASPLARKIALERGIPLGQVKGTGPEGRITKVSCLVLCPLWRGSRMRQLIPSRRTLRSILAAVPLPVLLPAVAPLPPPHQARPPSQVKSRPSLLLNTRTSRSLACAARSERGCWRASSSCRITTSPSR